MSAYDPWPDMGKLCDYDYFAQFTKSKLVHLCVAHMRRARLEIVQKEEARRLAEFYYDEHHRPKGLHEWMKDVWKGYPKLPWKEGK